MRKIAILVAAVLAFTACRKEAGTASAPAEDTAAKKMLQGIWLNDDDEGAAFRAKGDTIYYPDTTSMPVYFKVVDDTLVLCGAKEVKYHILKQTAHLFVFENQSGDQIHLVKSTDPSDMSYFGNHRTVALNQRQLIKRDSVVTVGGNHYHYYVQVNPTTYKVVKTSYNDDGVAVDNIYYDNIVHLSVYNGASCLFSSDFRKRDFAGLVPQQYLSQSVLSDIVYYQATAAGIEFVASLAIPDSASSFQIKITIAANGKKKMQVFG